MEQQQQLDPQDTEAPDAAQIPLATVVVAVVPGLVTVKIPLTFQQVEPRYEGEPPVYEVGVEGLLKQIVRALEIAQKHKPLKSREQALAITKLEESVHWLESRQEGR